jgi:hypothetical protein
MKSTEITARHKATVLVRHPRRGSSPIQRAVQFYIEHEHWNTGFRVSYIGTDTRQGSWFYNINQPLADARLCLIGIP